ncbi:MAG: zf-TFIIB domain-containing protein [Gemmatimonadales bacterium]
MATDKPSRNEEEYFARREAELIEQRRSEAERQRVTAERESHFMKCPKCGAGLETEAYHHVDIDRCPECHGIWLDAGEIEALVGKDDDSFASGLFSSIWKLGGKRS